MADHLLYLLSRTKVDEELIPPNIHWMNDIDPLKDFFDWMSNCVSDRNCITTNELRMFEILKNEDKLLDEPTLKVELESNFSGTVNVYPDQNDIDLLENFVHKAELQNCQLMEYKKKIEYQLKTMEKKKTRRRIKDLKEMELEKLNMCISGEYRRLLNSFAADCRLLNSKINASEKDSGTTLISRGSLDKCYRQFERLKKYVVNFMKIVEKTLKEGKNGSEYHEFYDTNFIASNLRAVYNDCVMTKFKQTQILAEIEGIKAVMNLLDQDLLPDFSVTSRTPEEIQKIEADVTLVCKAQVDALMKGIELELFEKRRDKYEYILSTLNDLKEVAMPLKLCEESILILLRNEWQWLVFAKDLLKESCEFIDDLHESIQELSKHISHHEAVSSLSCTVTPDTSISSLLIKLLDGYSDSLYLTDANKSTSFFTSHGQSMSSAHKEEDMIENYVEKQYHAKINELLASIDEFSSEALNVISTSKMSYNYVFPGPTATPCLHTRFRDFKMAVITNEERLRAAKEKLDQAQYRYDDLKLLRQVQPGIRIHDLFWLYYREDPNKLEQAVEAISNESEVLKQYHDNILQDNLCNFLDDLN